MAEAWITRMGSMISLVWVLSPPGFVIPFLLHLKLIYVWLVIRIFQNPRVNGSINPPSGALSRKGRVVIGRTTRAGNKGLRTRPHPSNQDFGPFLAV